MLKNPAYIGMRSVPSPDGPLLVEAVWPGIIGPVLFERLQALMAANARTGHNATARISHTYVLSGGLTHCGRCGGAIEGRSGVGHLGKKYCYYVCRSGCGMRVPAEQLEGAVLDRLRALGADPATVEALTAATNRRLARELPKLRKGREALSKQLPRLAAEADTVLTEWAAVPTGRAFVEDRLGTLSARRDDLHRGIADLDRQIAEIEAATASASTVCEAIRHIDEVYDCLRPHERKELFKLLLRSVEVGERQIVLEIYAGAAAHGAEAGVDAGALRIGRLGWLPDEDSNLEPSG